MRHEAGSSFSIYERLEDLELGQAGKRQRNMCAGMPCWYIVEPLAIQWNS
jgi:hypothetical protein